VAESDRARVRAGVRQRPHQHRHRVRVVEEDGVGTQLAHVLGDGQEDRNRAQGAEDATDAERVADRLPQAEARWDLKVTQRGIEAADLNLVDDEVGPVERRAAVEVRLDSEPGAGRVVDVPAIRSAVASRSGSMSWSTTVDSASSGKSLRSASRMRVNSTLPAPIREILGMFVIVLLTP
jgi:hypothetical protein